MGGIDAAGRTRWRIRSLGLEEPRPGRPADVVRAQLVVQSQDHQPALWSVGQRLAGATVDLVAEAFAAGEFVRTHLLRPTWHFVAAADLPWLQRVTAPRVEQGNQGPYRQEGLDPAVRVEGLAVIEAALSERSPQTRAALGEALGRAGIEAAGRRLSYLMMHAELSLLICSGPLVGKQHSYRLVPPSPPGPEGEAALAELGLRYATSHGPVTPHDLATWATLTLAQARRALATAELVRLEVDGVEHWHPAGQDLPPPSQDRWLLLQTYDELVVGYANSAHLLGSAGRTLAQRRREPQGVLLHGGRLVGRWRRTITPDRVLVEVLMLEGRSPAELAGLEVELAAHAGFLGREPDLVMLT